MVVEDDLFSGGISVGSSGVSFWGGAGADTFNFSTESPTMVGTATSGMQMLVLIPSFLVVQLQ